MEFLALIILVIIFIFLDGGGGDKGADRKYDLNTLFIGEDTDKKSLKARYFVYQITRSGGTRVLHRGTYDDCVTWMCRHSKL